jgi:hypothetical protein
VIADQALQRGLLELHQVEDLRSLAASSEPLDKSLFEQLINNLKASLVQSSESDTQSPPDTERGTPL